MEYLYGVQADTLEDANTLIERALGIRTEAREGLHNGGDYFSLRTTDVFVKLRENVDLDDTELEFNGLHEVDFPDWKWLLYIESKDVPANVIAALSDQPNTFKKLRQR